MDPEMTKRFQTIIDKGVHAEMCQVSMKLYNKTLDNLAKGFVAHLASRRSEADRGSPAAGLSLHQAVTEEGIEMRWSGVSALGLALVVFGQTGPGGGGGKPWP